MALKISLSESDVGPGFPEAYARVIFGRSFKMNVVITVDFHADEESRLNEKNFIQQRHYEVDVEVVKGVTEAGDHPHAPLYRHLKTLPEFAGAIDV